MNAPAVTDRHHGRPMASHAAVAMYLKFLYQLSDGRLVMGCPRTVVEPNFFRSKIPKSFVIAPGRRIINNQPCGATVSVIVGEVL